MGKVNLILVGFGQQICLPTNPRCDDCLVNVHCPVGRVNVKRIAKGLTPIKETKEEAKAKVKRKKATPVKYEKFDETKLGEVGEVQREQNEKILEEEEKEGEEADEKEEEAKEMEAKAESLENGGVKEEGEEEGKGKKRRAGERKMTEEAAVKEEKKKRRRIMHRRAVVVPLNACSCNRDMYSDTKDLKIIATL